MAGSAGTSYTPSSDEEPGARVRQPAQQDERAEEGDSAEPTDATWNALTKACLAGSASAAAAGPAW